MGTGHGKCPPHLELRRHAGKVPTNVLVRGWKVGKSNNAGYAIQKNLLFQDDGPVLR